MSASLTASLASLPPLQRQQFLATLNPAEWAELEEDSRRLIRSDLTAWCVEALADRDQKPARHHLFLINELKKVATGETDRLMVFMPPGHAKTEYATLLFSAWLLAQRDGIDLIGASYGQDYADRNSRKIIRLLQLYGDVLGIQLRSEAVSEWETVNRGTYRAAGAGGGITGRRADLITIDDPFKGRQEADSLTIREKVWNWYRAEVITRLKPGARILIILTRWHEDDLAGRLLNQAQSGGDQWRIINLPAIAEENDMLGRQPGEALWPEWENVAALTRKRAVIGEREWAALFQQRPRPIEGTLFKAAMIDVMTASPPCVSVVRSWDLAATKKFGTNDPDWTVGVKLGRTANNRYIVQDVVRLRGGPDEVEAAIVNTASQDGRRVQIRLSEDPGQAGKSQTLYLTRKLAGYTVSAERETGDKATRAGPVASQCNVGNLSMVESPVWNMHFRDELAAFPSGTHDDQVDGLSGAFRVIGMSLGPMRISREAKARFGAR
jgi:predicted phage terminase large subunit-like protein